jgi:hypothetical protein
MASLVSKKYQRGAHFQFGKTRKQVWRWQLFLLVLVCILGYPTTLLSQARKKLAHSPTPNEVDPDKIAEKIEYNKAIVEKIDRVTFWAFFTGIWKDPRPDVMWSFYGVVVVISICLLYERMFITWLHTRDGCTYNRFQKYIEMDIRRECLLAGGWHKKEPPKYHPERYRNHYYEQDFDELLLRFKESDKEAKMHEKELRRQGVREIRNFIPYRVALRVQEAIRFSVMLDGRAEELKIDSQTSGLLDKWDKYCYDVNYPKRKHVTIQEFVKEHINIDPTIHDYEEYDVLKDHKIKLLQSQIEEAISRKYRISFARGVRIFYEQCILFLLMMAMLLKSNVYSIIYLLYVIKYMLTETKLFLLIRLVRTISLIMIL